MARKILCSEFDLTARRLAIPTLNIPRRLAPEQRKWDFTQHRGIKDCVPVREVSEDSIFFGGEFVPTRKFVLSHADFGFLKGWGRAGKCDLHSFNHGRMRHNFSEHHGTMTRKDQTKTIKGRREEVVRESRRLSREFRKFVLASLDELDRKEF